MCLGLILKWLKHLKTIIFLCIFPSSMFNETADDIIIMIVVRNVILSVQWLYSGCKDKYNFLSLGTSSGKRIYTWQYIPSLVIIRIQSTDLHSWNLHCIDSTQAWWAICKYGPIFVLINTSHILRNTTFTYPCLHLTVDPVDWHIWEDSPWWLSHQKIGNFCPSLCPHCALFNHIWSLLMISS